MSELLVVDGLLVPFSGMYLRNMNSKIDLLLEIVTISSTGITTVMSTTTSLIQSLLTITCRLHYG